MPTATMTSKGQVTIPIEVREELNLTAGSRIDFIRRDDAYILVPSSRPISRLSGFFGKYDGEPVSIEEMNEAVAEGIGVAS